MPLAGHDAGGLLSAPIVEGNFNPRAPYGARQQRTGREYQRQSFQSTCPLQGTTPTDTQRSGATDCISIHVPLAEHDGKVHGGLLGQRGFQSTCPLRGTTASGAGSVCPAPFPLAGHDAEGAVRVALVDISIHMPLAGHDIINRVKSLVDSISIHMPLAGHDPLHG